MNSYDDLYGSRFLAATDLKAPTNAVIERIEQETFTRDGGPSRRKAVLFFKNRVKGIVCNKTNAITLGDAFGKDFVSWVGKTITITPENTTFGGKLVKALRLYPAQNNLGPPAPTPQDELNDETIPF
jgi:hypothetical protein